MRVVIEFDTDSAAFRENFGQELWFQLRKVQEIVVMCYRRPTLVGNTPLLDSNGNTIGRVEVRA